MHNSKGQELVIGDLLQTNNHYGIVEIVNISHDYIMGKNKDGDRSFGYTQMIFLEEFPDCYKIHSWEELAIEAMDAQSACNMSGVVHSFSEVIREVRDRLRWEGKESTANVNNHPVCILYANKISSLCMSEDKFSFAYNWAKDQEKI